MQKKAAGYRLRRQNKWQRAFRLWSLFAVREVYKYWRYLFPLRALHCSVSNCVVQSFIIVVQSNFNLLSYILYHQFTMKFLLLALLAAPAALCAAVPQPKLPAGDGVWVVHYNAHGQRTSEPILLAPANTTDYRARRDAEASSLVTRQRGRSPETFPISTVGCSRYKFTEGDADCARNILANWADKGTYVGPNAVVYAQCLSAQWYMCVYGQSSRAWRVEIEDCVPNITEKCSANGGGWGYSKKYDKAYGRNKAGVNECW
jgi:hypothetical protein